MGLCERTVTRTGEPRGQTRHSPFRVAGRPRPGPVDRARPQTGPVIIGGTAEISTAPARPPLPTAEPVLTRPGLVLVVVIGTWTAVPTMLAPPKLGWALTAVLLALVANALWRHVHRVRWTAPVTLLTVVLAAGVVSSAHFGTMVDLLTNGATALLVLGCGLLAACCGPADARLLARGLVLRALSQLAVALAVLVGGVPAPWELPGTMGRAFEDNPLLPSAGARLAGTLAHPIPFGTLLAVAAALCVPRLTGWRLPVRRVLAAALCCGIALSGSRSAVLALGVALIATVLAPGVLRISTAWRIVAVLALTTAVLMVDTAELTVVSSLQGTGSLTHRVAAWEAVGRLADRSPVQALFGSGAGSLPDLFASGLLQLDGFFAVDNQLVATFAVAGLVGVVALVGAVAVGLLRGHRATRPAALVVVLMFAVFDVLEWTATSVLVAVLLCLGTARPTDGAPDSSSPGDPSMHAVTEPPDRTRQQ